MNQTTWTRRQMLSALGAGALTAALGGNLAHAAKRKPNVIVIFTDDQGAMDLNCYGSSDLHTPNLDALAAKGVRFTQFYVAAPVCSPSRAALLTGRCIQRAGVPNNVGYDNGLPPEQVTIAEMLKADGYKTACFGKWHLGESPRLAPTQQGFDEFFGHKHGCIDNYSHFFYWSGPNCHDMWRNDTETFEEDGNFFPDLIVREASRFMDEHQDEPFFMYLPFNIPHYPVQPKAKHRDLYPDDMEQPRKAYAAFVTTLDEKIGEVVDKVDSLGLREDTLIIYLSDHGHSEEERNFFGGGNPGPYRGHKFNLWEGGIRVPCITSMPGTIPQGEVRDQMAASIDWLPTIAHYTGAKPPAHKLDGANIAPVINSATAPTPHDELHWIYRDHWVVRQGPWKLVHNGPETTENGKKIPKVKYFLSNLDQDVTETNNLADQHPDVVKRLVKLHEKWEKQLKNA